ncbi:hypothetical protein RJ639_012368 [Escallonia herrerae]|uniref:UBC core domain-containing protein n=1 Tax=Escallonia herrerae TaxID=1293975 RepID=A0AA88VLH6_9ASTE|nr:hypothetical protein RJ639_012368 [Escallonia herrerae]
MASEIEQSKQFDAVTGTDYSNHRYFNKPQKGDPLSFKAMKKIMQEWEILNENLPESIYVRVYEGKIDLMRTVIIGAAGTPYHDGLFFVDLAFLATYPDQPPQVSYHAHGLRLNPNLYESGRVCLSLLITRSGGRNERWDPSSSTVLQVLVSLQGLVLNEEPFYNEPHYAMKKNRYNTSMSKAYTKEAFVSSCRMMQAHPRILGASFADHFRKRTGVKRAACKAYPKGDANVGYYGIGSISSPRARVSRKFKDSMSVLYPKLDVAFTKIGAPDFQDNADQLETVGSKRKRAVAESEQKGNDSTETVGSKTEKAPAKSQARNNGKKTKENETVSSKKKQAQHMPFQPKEKPNRRAMIRQKLLDPRLKRHQQKAKRETMVRRQKKMKQLVPKSLSAKGETEQKGNDSTETVGSKTEKAPAKSEARNNGKKTKENETAHVCLVAFHDIKAEVKQLPNEASSKKCHGGTP